MSAPEVTAADANQGVGWYEFITSTAGAGIAAGHDKALDGIAARLREVAAAVRDAYDTAQLAKEATTLVHRNAEHDRRLTVLEGETLEALNTAERERDEARAEVERLRDQLADAPASEGAARDAVDAAQEEVERLRVQVERVRALADEYARGRGGPTAKRIREALDEPKGENEGA